MSIVVRCEQDYRTEIQIRDHSIIADELIEDGGMDEGPTPLEIFTGMIAACVAVTTRAYAQRKHWALEGITLEIEMQRYKGDEYPSYGGGEPYVHEVREQICFEGALTDEQKDRLLVIAAKCPIHTVLDNPVFFKSKLQKSECYQSKE